MRQLVLIVAAKGNTFAAVLKALAVRVEGEARVA